MRRFNYIRRIFEVLLVAVYVLFTLRDNKFISTISLSILSLGFILLERNNTSKKIYYVLICVWLMATMLIIFKQFYLRGN